MIKSFTLALSLLLSVTSFTFAEAAKDAKHEVAAKEADHKAAAAKDAKHEADHKAAAAKEAKH